ncbi:MAG TPA: alpha/beta fold hydrolase [Vicinamibacterales bacterium]|jgi:predicted alpha/beta-fold hydrolase|nr:alpha/beta fold hydrolase [Vicinamibacterales bacterium]
MKPFVPRRRLGRGHWMTLFCWAAPRRFQLPAAENRLFQVTPDTQVLAHCYWQPQRRAHPTLLALHGLEGSSTAHYMRGLAQKALDAGFNAVLLNQRNCGGTEHLGPGLYHSGLIDDAEIVIRELGREEGLDRFVAAGYSLGGNLALRLAGARPPESLPALKAVCAVSPVLELEACIRALERRSNFIYQWNFVRNLKARMRRKDLAHPGRFDLSHLRRIRTVRQFDAAYTAPFFGFRSAEDYYQQAAAMRVIDRIRIPALIITAEDDPFVPVESFRDPKIANNPNITLVIAKHGGHCGFLGEREGPDDGYWAEARIIDFARAHAE